MEYTKVEMNTGFIYDLYTHRKIINKVKNAMEQKAKNKFLQIAHLILATNYQPLVAVHSKSRIANKL